MNEQTVKKEADTKSIKQKYYKVFVGRFDYLDMERINEEANKGSKLITIVHKFAIFERIPKEPQTDIFNL